MKRNFDEELIEPIEFTLGGEDYVVKELTADVMDGIDKILADEKDDVHTKMRKQLSVMTGKTPEHFAKYDLRKLIKVTAFITENIMGEKSKNSQAAGK